MADAQHRLGLSCPTGGQFYICENANIRFIGCCTVDPCTDERGGQCPTDSLRPSSFSSDAYNKIGQQTCFSPKTDKLWYTCKATEENQMPFLGCCEENPCSASGCPSNALYPARLSDNPDKASIFLSDAASTNPNSSGESFPLGAIIGIALGAVAIIGVLIAFLMYRRTKRRRTEKEVDEAAQLYNPNYQGQNSPGFVSNWTGSQPGSPGFAYQPYNQSYQDNLSSTATDYTPDSRHVSRMSGMTWDAVAANINRKRYSEVPQGVQVTELEGTTAVPAQTHQVPRTQSANELDGRNIEPPRVIAELPATDQR